MKDYYQVLGVSRSAGDNEIKQAYRRLARTYHPDMNPGDAAAETRFKELNEAYEVLSDKEQRAKYDRFGADFKRYEQGMPGGGFDYGAGGDFGDIFETLFGAGGARRGPGAQMRMNGQDIEQPIEVTLEEAYSGTQRSLQFSGGGQPRTLTVKIPAGVDNGSRIRVAGEGGPGYNGGNRGDLFLNIKVQPSVRYERNGDELTTRVDVNAFTLMLGGQLQVPLLSGKTLTLTIPAGTQNSRKFRVTGQGMPHMRGSGRGDLFVVVQAQLPTALNERARELVEALRRETGMD
jgi:curved DNA-binding protein